jgi:Ca2+-binding EF-hand superfamily protein
LEVAEEKEEEDLELKEWLVDVKAELRERMREFRDHFDEVFDEFDVDADGIITFNEFSDGVRLVGMPMSDKDCRYCALRDSV